MKLGQDRHHKGLCKAGERVREREREGEGERGRERDHKNYILNNHITAF